MALLRPATSKVTRGETILSRIGSNMGITPCGRDWLIASLDPMHDNQLSELAGYPDVINTPSVIRQVKQMQTISGPTGGTGNWDAHVVVWPWLSAIRLDRVAGGLGNYLADGVYSGGAVHDQVSVYTQESGTGSWISSIIVGPEFGLSLPNTIQSGKGRLVAMGIEVVNTTSQLNKQGSVLGYRGPATAREAEAFTIYSGGTYVNTRTMRNVPRPPDTNAQAMAVPGTRMWEAEEGIYMVVAFEGDNPATQPQQIGPYILTSGEIAAGGDGSINGQPILVNANGDVGNSSHGDWIHMAPICQSGVIFTGLSLSTSLQLTVNWYYEDFPASDSDLLTLATPSCEYDPIALKTYTEVLTRLPVCVPASWNPAGEWFWDVVTAIKDHAATVGGLIGGPAGAAVGAAASTVAGWARDRYLTAPGNTKPKAKPRTAPSRAPPPPPVLVVKEKSKPKAKSKNLTPQQRKNVNRAINQLQQAGRL